MPVRIIATADVHLGMKFSGYGELASDLAEARFVALERVVAVGNERSCDLLIIAGDLFDRVSVASVVVERAAAILSSFEGALVAVLPGNHDYLSPSGDRLWRSFADAAGDRTLLLDRAAAVPLDHYDLPVTLLAAPCDSLHGATHRVGYALDTDRSPWPDSAVIGVAHGSIDGITLDTDGVYFPMSVDLLRRTVADCWIIGHTHRFHDLKDARTVVPGTPEPDGFDVRVPGGAALVDVTADGDGERGDGGRAYSAQMVETGVHRFVDADVELDSTLDPCSQIEAVVPGPGSIVRVRVSGRLDEEAYRAWNLARESLLADATVYRIDDDDVQQILTLEQIDRDYVAGSFAHSILKRLVEADDHDAVTEAHRLMRESSL